jgi:hypothetical protein
MVRVTALAFVGAIAAVFAYAVLTPDSRDAELVGVYGSPESKELEVMWGDCATGARLNVEESVDQVVITGTIPLPPGAACDSVGIIEPITLDTPLGDRDVIDGGSGERLRIQQGTSH